MLDSFVKMFSRKDPARAARNCLTRIITRFDMTRISYREGLIEDRRLRQERNEAIGVWIFPQHVNSLKGHFEVAAGVPAVTYDFRSNGMGILTPVKLNYLHFVVATPDETGSWKFFKGDVRHNTRKAGGWYLIGLEVVSMVELESEQFGSFRDHIAGVCEDQ